MPCPCPDEACADVHAHDVTAAFTVQLPPLSAMLGKFLRLVVPDGE